MINEPVKVILFDAHNYDLDFVKTKDLPGYLNYLPILY